MSLLDIQIVHRSTAPSQLSQSDLHPRDRSLRLSCVFATRTFKEIGSAGAIRKEKKMCYVIEQVIDCTMYVLDTFRPL
jgi:hypothetical protein